MGLQATPTKGNLINNKKSLELAKVGYELLDKKRNILIREMMQLIDKANEIQNKIDSSFEQAYLTLQTANITMGYCEEFAESIPVEESLKLDYRSVMGVEIPILTIEPETENEFHCGLNDTNTSFDDAHAKFVEVKMLVTQLAEIENSVYRLANAISKTQKHANALKNIMIPRFEETVKFITNALDEKEREEFSRLKVVKKKKQREDALEE